MASKFVFPPLHPNTGVLLHDESAITVREEPDVHVEFYRRDVDIGVASGGAVPGRRRLNP